MLIFFPCFIHYLPALINTTYKIFIQLVIKVWPKPMIISESSFSILHLFLLKNSWKRLKELSECSFHFCIQSFFSTKSYSNNFFGVCFFEKIKKFEVYLHLLQWHTWKHFLKTLIPNLCMLRPTIWKYLQNGISSVFIIQNFWSIVFFLIILFFQKRPEIYLWIDIWSNGIEILQAIRSWIKLRRFSVQNIFWIFQISNKSKLRSIPFPCFSKLIVPWGFFSFFAYFVTNNAV